MEDHLQSSLRRMQRDGAHLALAVDESGHPYGVMTLEDMLEELVGQIRDDSRAARSRTVNGLEGAGVAGDLISWIGLILGLPVLLVGMLLRSGEKGLVPTEIVLVADGGTMWARWFSAGEFHERPLSGAERARLAGQDVCRGYVSRRDPSVLRFERRTPATSVCLALGSTFVVLGLCGFALSLLPMVFG